MGASDSVRGVMWENRGGRWTHLGLSIGDAESVQSSLSRGRSLLPGNGNAVEL